MKEWPDENKNEQTGPPASYEELAEKIGSALQSRWRQLTFTTNPEPRSFQGFGTEAEINSFLASQGIDTTNLTIETDPLGRSVKIFAPGNSTPVLDQWYGDGSDDEPADFYGWDDGDGIGEAN